MWSRREFLEEAAKISAGVSLAAPASRLAAASQLRPGGGSPGRRSEELATPIELRRGAAEAVPLVPDFLGLGYEMSSVATAGLLSRTNGRYVRLVRQLGPEGVLRVGGIVADYTRYAANGTPSSDRHDTVITRSRLEQFRGFLEATGWTTLWSLNFAQGSIDDAVDEAKAVAAVLRGRLKAFEIGNEVENYSRGETPFRRPPYSYETYRAEYSRWRAAILGAVPDARFAAPDTAVSIAWVERMAADAHGEVQLLTTHYYRGGQGQGTAEQLLQPDPKLLDMLARLRSASEKSGIPWRLCETNSFFGGGRPGVSDTFTGALWVLDLCLLLAKYVCSGVNVETGVNQLGFLSSYSPIRDDGQGKASAGVPYYGMLAFAVARRGCSHSMEIAVPSVAAGVTAYGLGDGRRVAALVLVNRGEREFPVSVASLGLEGARVLRLTAPSLESRTGARFGGAAVDGEGRWMASDEEVIRASRVTVAGASAVVVQRQV